MMDVTGLREGERNSVTASIRAEMTTPDMRATRYDARILVVDDESAITELVTTALRFIGYDVQAASSGSETWNNTDSVTHRIVANDGSFDTGNIAPGASSPAMSVSADGARYHCSIHPTMVGVVNNSSGGTPPCTGLYC